MAVARDTDPGEPRVSATPDTVKRFKGLGADVLVARGAGLGSGINDADYEAAGAEIGDNVTADADLILKVRRPAPNELSSYKKGALVIAIMDPYGNEAALKEMADAGLIAFAMELMPRITRAQSMDVLSSQANLAGYQAVIDAASEFDRAMPMMMTAAGTVPAAKVFVMGAGVAGLQAIATGRRLGAIVSAFDTRAVVREQVESLGARFLEIDIADNEGEGGYATELGEEAHRLEQELVARHVAESDMVVTTALIPGRRAPVLITADAVASMRAGSVVVDLAAEAGGNCELTRPGHETHAHGVTVLGPVNLPSTMAWDASTLYARNVGTFARHLAPEGELVIDDEDEITRGALITRDGAVVHQATLAQMEALAG
jgi:NAD(P) transhydrogenase subunit alpha